MSRKSKRKAAIVQNSGYSQHGAGSDRNATRGWFTDSRGPTSDIDRNVVTLRKRSRDLWMGGSPIVTGALKTIRTNVVGAGLRLSPNIDAASLGMSEDEADVMNRKLAREFSLWADNYDCDASRTLNFAQLQGLVLLSACMNGDVFATLPVIPRPGRLYDLRVNLIEADRVMNSDFDDYLSNKVVAGVEVDRYGAPVAYYINEKHPGDNWFVEDIKRVPAFGAKTGRRNVLHILADYERPGQRRGIPLVSSVLESLKQLGRYTESELMAALTNSYFAVFIQKAGMNNPLQASNVGRPEAGLATANDIVIGSGTVVELQPGESIQSVDSKRPSAGFESFTAAIIRQIGTALEIPYEVLMKQFDSSYSASRAALNEAWRMFDMRQIWLSKTFCQPVYEEWLAEAVAKGRISAPGFFEDPGIRAAWSRATWIGPKSTQLDPLKEVNAAILRVNNNFSTREHEAPHLSGLDAQTIARINARDRQALIEMGIAIPPTPETIYLESEGNEEQV